MYSKILKISIFSLSLSMVACGGENAEQNNVTTEIKNEDVTSYTITDEVADNIIGAGASFPTLIYQKWSDEYKKETGGKVSYDTIGSSGGLQMITKKSVDFGASDRPLTPEELAEQDLIQFPTVIGGIVPIVNISGISAGELVLTGKILAEIYLGKIKKWNHPQITALNPNLQLPNENIITIHRSDGSGSTYNLSHYLNQTTSHWSAIGVNKLLDWPTDKLGTGFGANGSKELVQKVQESSNSIGYIDYSYAKKNGLTHTAMVNAAGTQVQPSHESFAAAGDIDWSQHSGFYKLITNSDAKEAWPIATTTFILVHKKPQDPKKVAGVLNFFNWAYMKGYQSALDLDFVPFSDKPVAIFLQEWTKIVDENGKPVYTPHSNI